MTGARWFASDLHLRHRFVASLRGYGTCREDADTDAHDREIDRVWRQQVAERDEVFVLGDLTASQTDYALAFIADLPGRKHLIAGNHDEVASIHRNGWKHQRRYLEVFESVRDFGRIRMQGRDVLMSHYPYLGQSDEHPGYPGGARYREYRLRDEGLPLIHGHTHIADQRLHHSGQMALVWPDGSAGQAEPVERAVPGTPQVHVGWDAWGRLVALHEIETLLFGEGS